MSFAIFNISHNYCYFYDHIVVTMDLTVGMASMDVMDVMVCMTSIAAMSTFSPEAFAAALPEQNCSDSCNGQRGCNGPNGYNG